MNCCLPYLPSKDVGNGKKEMLNRNSKFSYMSVLSWLLKYRKVP
jgi:hypothetical protein